MPEFVTLSCPTCGGQLQITSDIDRFACAHCGNEHIVKRGGGIVMLAPVVKGLAEIQRGTDRTAIELTIRRLKEEIRELDEEIAALAGKTYLRDKTGVAAALQRMKLVSLRRYMTMAQDPASINLCRELIGGLTESQSQELVGSYEGQAIFKTKKVKSTASMLRDICKLKEQQTEKKEQIDEQLGIIAGA